LVEVVVATKQWAAYIQCVGVEESKELTCACLWAFCRNKEQEK